MSAILVVLAALIASGACAYHRTSLKTWAIATAVTTLVVGVLAGAPVTTIVLLLLLAAVAVPLLMVDFRRKTISAPLLSMFAKVTPKLSDTEQTALEAGTVGFEGELFSGKPDWSQLLRQPKPELSVEEQAFLDGPVEELCAMVDDWQITHELADLPPEVWDFIKKNKFFGMIIPKSYGGLGFSALAHSAVLQKLSSMSQTLASTVAVPNSLGPGELLMHYGSDEQKNHYLPRLADGREIPCFALTGPYAGSDATSLPDFGIVCKGLWNGEETVGIRLTFDKRYITLAPVATIVGLAFRMYDPEKLLGDKEDLGITLALLPRETPGMQIGRRHFPLNTPFQNGPIHAKDMFVPLSVLIGGPHMAGHGWRMLVECLSVGRAISLPSNATGASRMAVAATGAYARMRKQFGLAIGRFEGVEEALARIGGLTYATQALSRATAAAVDRGEKPAVPSAIAKYHATEWCRQIASDAMDVHGGKGVILGPKNYMGRGWQSVPIAITVEGANIMTRSLMIFGQGAIRCHPYVLKEMQALNITDYRERLKTFDKVLFGHIGFGFSNAVRSFVLGVTAAKIGEGAGDAYTRRYYRKLNRYSAALALCADVAMGVLGGKLKFKEKLSARLGDVLSYLYIASAMLKRYEDTGRPEADRPLLAWAFHECMWRIQNALDGVIRNFPVRPVAWLLRFLVFPFGRREVPPSDRLGRRVAALITAPSEARDRLTAWAYLSPTANNTVGRMNAILPDVIAAEPVERKLVKALKSGQLRGHTYNEQLAEAEKIGAINAAERDLLQRVRDGVAEFISVDDFDSDELRANVVSKAQKMEASRAA
ncbi:acyl-CoA dehydrogenase [Luteibacter sp. PPL201]|uniref:Acyl-coenzyme A dehydrogenase n=1 Tax=Luteibacter sahnii TaxID=3021977 RepID=A0ABT6BA10_9GAMM|nr:acyl-CoA dehydrogenase [Luteibacter sp. PPL193]MDY1546851.1 acyl-CoA dehydrogenase [Luteibacter sp. PPL193]